MITAQEFKRAAIASGRTMDELARLLGKTRSQIYNYRREGVSRPASVETVRQRMGLWLRDEQDEPFQWYTDDELVRELGRRLRELRDATLEGEDSRGGGKYVGDGSKFPPTPEEGVVDGTLGRRPRPADEG